jgi:Zn-dependent metalloprotease
MKSRPFLPLLPVLIFLVAGTGVCTLPLRAQEQKPSRDNKVSSEQTGTASLQQTVFAKAAIRRSRETGLPSDIRLDASTTLNKEEFFTNLRKAFTLPDQLQFVQEQETTGPRGVRHIRYTQYYRGLELARTQYMVHLKEGRVTRAHGPLIGKPVVDLVPTLNKEEAYQAACRQMGMSEKEARQKEALMSRLSLRKEAGKENGKLMLSSGTDGMTAEQYRLVYVFDMTTTDPLQRFDVEIDAHTGELAGRYPTLYRENIPTTGSSLYNGTVDIVISDTIFKSEWPDNKAYWHTDTWNAFLGSGTSWWMGDTADFTPGGYNNDWYVALETDPIPLSGMNPRLTFYHRYAMEAPEGAADYDDNYDGWDGINVRISTDGGTTWEVLTGPVPAYSCTSLWSFGEIYGQGTGIPGWAGSKQYWTQVNFDLTAYLGETVNLRFDFASDAGYCTLDDNSLFGWQVDDIEVRNNSGVLYSNSGTDTNMHAYSIANWVGNIEGKYRLRETTRGKGIATINAESGTGFTNYVDFVQDTYPIVSSVNRAGVEVHWVSEQTYDYYLGTFGRNSFDNDGGAIISYVDWMEGDDRNNAFWAGTYAAFGAGDGIIHGSFGAVDVVGHEITHGVTDHSAGLIYSGESGALNESFSDIFGTAVEFYSEGGDKGDWLVGEDVYLTSGAIRSMSSPKAFSDPDTYLGEYWYDTNLGGDNGGVHTNSGVQNHWFYLLSEGGSGENDDGISFQVAGIGLEDASAIAYSNLTNYLLPDSRYADAATYSIQAAGDLFGEGSQQAGSVRSAWEAVGIYMNPYLSVSDTLHFESEVEGATYSTLTLRNKGIETLTVTGFQFSDPVHFAFQQPPATPLQINGGDSQQYWIKFLPDQPGLYDASMTINSSDPLNPVQNVQLMGTGTESATALPETYQDVSGPELSVRPNPFTDRLLVTYALPKPQPVIIEIRDITGKLLYQLARDASANETLEIIWSNLPRNPGKASGGIYLLSLRTSAQVLVKKLVRR